MNKTHHVVWNEITGTWVAVPEHARRRGKRGPQALALAALALAAQAALAAPGAQELPTGGQVVAGQAGISQSGSTLTVNQASPRAAIDWRTFNVGSQATVNFVQPDSKSVALNRVSDANPSQIFGRINANGQVFLSNPSGIYFAPGASVNVGGLVATTHRISLDDFMAGKATFERNGATGSVINQGELKAALAGYIALLAPEVRNEGVIVAHMGTVVLAAGEAFELQFDAGNTLAGLRVTPSSIRALVDNRSAVLAPGGLIILSAQAMDRVQGGVVQNSGRIEATGLQQRGGRIVLSASSRIENTGVIAANAGADGPAGTVTLTAPEVVNSGVIEAKGSVALPTGGSVQIAAGEFKQAESGVLDVSAPVQAGDVTIHASAAVTLAGRVDATSTAEAGAGGAVTVQAAQITLADARVDTSGGRGGSIELDASAPASDAPPAPQPAPEPGKVVLYGGTQVASRGRRSSGGSVTLLGDDLALNDTTLLDATGATAGGQVRVGGGWQGGDGRYQATQVSMAAGASIDVSATQGGNGGLAVLWSDALRDGTSTTVAGRITAAGAGASSHGGQVETSGHTLAVADTASVRTGPGGQWLLDPADITISGSADANQSNSGGVFTPGSGAGTATVNVTTLINALNSGDVTITTQNSGTAGSGNGDIFVNASIAKTGATDSTLTLRAARDIWFNGYGVTSANSKVNLVLVADWDSSGGGAIYFNGTTGGGAITVNTHGGHVWMGGNSYGSAFGTATWNGLTVGTGSTDAGNGTSIWEGVNLLSTTITTAGGDLLINARSDRFMNNEPRYGVIVKNSSISTGAGSITMTGRLGPTSGSQSTNPTLFGVRLEASTLATTTGAISITGGEGATDNSANTGGVGVSVYNSTVTTTGATGGGITITGTTGVNSGSNRRDGVRLESYGDSAVTTVSTVAGNIAITGTSNATSNANSAGVALQTGKAANTDTNNPVVKVVSQTGNVSLTGDNPANTDTGSTGVWFNGINYGKVYVGYDGSNAYSGNTTISGRSVVQNNFAGGYLALGGSGALTLQPTGNSFVQGSASYETLVLDSTWAFGSTHSALTIGRDIGSTAHADTVTVSNAITVAGPLSLYGANVNLNNNVTLTASGAALLAKASANIVQAADVKVVTNGGNVTYWADADNSGQGGINIKTSATAGGIDTRTNADRTATTNTTGGGRITLAGGLDDGGSGITAGGTAGDGIPDGYATNLSGMTGSNAGVLLGTDGTTPQRTNISLLSGSGDITLHAQSTQVVNGLSLAMQSFQGLTANAGTNGSIAIVGRSAIASGATSAGSDMASWRTNSSSAGDNVWRTVNGNISVVGTASGGTSENLGLAIDADNNYRVQFIASGTGSVSLTGTATGTASSGLRLTSVDLLAASGNISATAVGGALTLTANGGVVVGQKAGTPVTASTSALLLRADSIAFGNTITAAGSGTLQIDSSAASFSSALSTSNLSIGSGLTGLTIGKSTNTANITLANAINIAGPISVYGGTLTQSGALTSTQANAGVLLKATAGIANSANITTSAGDITLWANSAGATAGGIQVANNVTLASSGGAITLGGSAGGTVIAGAPATSTNGTALPQGYAQNFGASAAGVLLGTDNAATGQNSAVTINSGNGRIGMAGQSTQYVNTVSIGLMSYQGVNVNAGTGDIVLNGLSTGATAGGNTDIGFALAAYFGTGSGTSKWQSNGGNIVMNGTSSGATSVGIGADPQGGTNGTTVTIENTSASSGSVTINGSSTNAASLNIGIRSWNTNILSRSGTIALTATGAAGSSWNLASGYTTTIGSLAASDVTASTGNVTITADTLNTLGAININSTGALTVQSSGASFSAAQALANVNIASGLTGFTLGKSTNTADITVANAYTVGGPIAIYGGNVTLNGSLTNTAAGSGLLVKATGNISAAASTAFQTNNGNLTFWSDSDANSIGAISLGNSTSFNSAAGLTSQQTGGGRIVLAGGADANADGIPDGYAFSNTGHGISFGTTSASITSINSGGGDVLVRGKTSVASGANYGVNAFGTLNVLSGVGAITMAGESAASYGLEFSSGASSGTSLTLSSAKTSGTAISLTGVTTGSNQHGLVFDFDGVENILATGGGDIAISGTGTGTGYGVWLQNTNVLASAGSIGINGGSGGINVASGPAGSRIGKSSSGVTSSSSAVTLTGNVLNFAATTTVDSSGTLTLQSSGSSFTSSVSTGNLSLASSLTGLTVGKATNTGDITVASTTSIAGPIAIYGGNVALNSGMSSTAAGAAVLVKATGNIVQAGSVAVSTRGGSAIYWADSDNSGAGYIEVGSAASIDTRTAADRTAGNTTTATGGGRLVLAGGLDTNADGVPDGYAVSNLGTHAGIQLGALVANTTGATLLSGGGDIVVRAKATGASGSNAGGRGLAVVFQNQLNAGTGTLSLEGVSTNAHGIEIATTADGSTPTGANSWNSFIAGGGDASNAAIRITGSTATAGYSGLQTGWNNTSTTKKTLFQAVGAGGISLNADKVSLNATAFLSASGPINLTLGAGKTLDMNVASGGFQLTSASYGSCAVSECVDSLVTASTAAITISADAFNISTSTPVRINTTGAFTLQPAGNDFSSALNFNSTLWSLGSTVSALTLGKSSSADGGADVDVTLGSAYTVAGPISVYGANVAANATLTSTASGGAILLKGSGNVTVDASTSLITNGGAITLWADADASGAGGILVRNSATLDSRTSSDRAGSTHTTGGGAITLGGGLDDGGTASGASTYTSGLVQNDGRPDGYAVNYGNANLQYGILLGTELIGTGQSSGIRFYSGGGDIRLQGKVTNQNGANGPTGVMAYQGLGMNAGTNGSLTLLGVSALTSGQFSGGMDLQAWRSTSGTASTLQTVNGNITLVGVASGGTTNNVGINVQANDGTRQMTFAATGSGNVTLDGRASGTTPYDIFVSAISLLSSSGSVNVNARTSSLNFSNFPAASTVYFGAQSGSLVTSSSAPITLSADTIAFNAPVQANTTGTLTVQPYGTSFASALNWPISGLTLGAGVSGLTLGKASNTADITIASATSVAGPIAVYGGNIAINAGLTATGSNTITLKGSGSVTDGASGYVSASNLLLLGGNVTLDSASNAIGTLAASGVGTLTYLDTDALTLGSVAGTNGVSASGVVSLASRTGDLTVSQNVATTSTSASALTLNAGLNAAAGTASGGNLILTGSPSITVGSGGTALLYTGSVAGSTGLTARVGSGSGRFRYNSDESAANYTLALATGLNAIYREQPTVTRSIDNQSVTYGNAATYTFTVGNAQNGDSYAQAFAAAPTVSVGGSVSNANRPTAGTHTLSGTGGSASSQLGYAVGGSLADGTLTVTQRSLSVVYAGVDKVYDGSNSASATLGSDNRVSGDLLGLSWTSATFADANAAPVKTISLAGVSLSGADAANYTLASSTGSASAAITPRTVTLVGNKTYDGSTALGAGTLTLGNLVGSETLAYSGGVASSAHVAASGKYVTALTLADGSHDGLASNYQLPTLNASNAAVTITAAPLTASVSISGTTTKAYDGTTSASGATLSGSISGSVAGDTLTLNTSGVTLAYNSAHVVGASSIAASGSAGFTVASSSVGSLASDYSFTVPTIAAVTASITPATLTATLTNSGVTKVYDGSSAAPSAFTPSWSFSGLVAGDSTAALGSTGAAYNDANVVGATRVTVSGLAITGVTGSRGSVASDYKLDATTKDVAASITAKTVTIAGLTATGKTYDGTDSATVTQWGSVSGTVGGQTLQLSGSSASFADANAGTGKTVTASGYVLANGTGLASNYQLASTSATTTADIAKAALTVIANNDAKFVTQADASGYNGVSYSGFVNGETAAVLGGSVALNRSNGGTNAAGVYSGVLVADTSALTSTNYSFTTRTGDYTVVPSSQLLVRVANTSTTYGAAGSYSLTAAYYDGAQVVTLNGITSNGNNSYTVADGAGGSLTFTLAHAGAAFSTAGLLKVGSYQVDAAGISTTNAQNFSNVLTMVGSESITPKTVTASASGGISKVYDGTTAMTGVTLSLAGVVPQDTVTVAGAGAFTSKDAGNSNVGYAVSNLTLSGADGGNYVLTGGNSFSGSNGTIEQKTVQLSATKVYDGTTGLAGAVTVTTGVGGETLAYTGATASAAHVASNGSNFVNALTLADGTGGGLAANYRLPTLNATNAAVTITPKTLTASASIGGTLTKTYDGDTSAGGAQLTGNVNGAVSGDVLTLVTSGLTLAYDSAHVAGASAIQASGNAGFTIGSSTNSSAAGDYAFTQPVIANAAAGITPRTVSVSATKTYDGSTAVGGGQVTLGNLVTGESLGVSGATANSSHVADNGTNHLTALQLIDGSNGLASDYQLPVLNAANAAVTVSAKTLTTTAQIGGTTTKTYDGSTAATGATVSGSIGGAVSGDTLTLDASGVTLAYDSAHAGVATQIAATGSLGFAISGNHGSLASDYTLATPALTAGGSITPRVLATNASLGGAATKVYDGTAAATGATVSGNVTGGISGDNFTLVTSGLTLAYDSAHAGAATQIAATGSLGFSLTSTVNSLAGDYSLATPVLAHSASITPRALTTNASLTGVNSKTYDGTTSAGSLGVTGTVSGGIAGDSFTLDATGLTLAYNSAHVASANLVTATGPLGFGLIGSNGSLASDYSLATPTLSLAASITPRVLTAVAAISGTTTKVYDGNTTAAGATVTGSLGGALSGDTLTLDASGLTLAYDSAHAGAATQITAAGSLAFNVSGNHGSLASDYALATPALSVSASITPRALATNAGLAGAATKTYDGTTAATGATVSGNVTGGISGDSFTLASGGLTLAYDSAHAGAATQITASGSLGFALTSTVNSLANDYRLATPVLTRSASITPRALTTNASLSGATTKTYDGTTSANGISATGTVTGGIAGDSFTLDASGLTLAYNTAHVATANTVTATGSLAFGLATTNGSLASDYRLATPALSLAATITPRALTGTAAVTGPATKVYDGSTAATGNGVAGTVGGGIAGDTFVLDATGLAYAYDSAHVATASRITANGTLGFTLSGSSAGSLLSDYTWTAPAITSLQATITPRTLTASLANSGVTRAYDGGTAAPAGFTPAWSVAGLLGSDGVTIASTGAAYDSKDVASASTLTVSGLAVATVTGTAQAGDYRLAATSQRVAASITPKVVTVSGLTAADKTYDGTTTASITNWGTAATGVAAETLVVNGNGNGSGANFASRNAGAWTVTATGLQLADGTGLAANYRLADTSASTAAAAAITPRALHVGYTGVDKVYDGHTAASVATADDRITGDQLSVNWTATFADKNVGTAKAVGVSSVGLTGADAANYTVATTGNTTAAITRLATVTWTGGTSGNWFDPANWAGGAVPDLANVAQVVIPTQVTVTFDTTGAVSPAQAGKVQLDSLGNQGNQGSLKQVNGELAVGSGGVTLNGLVQQGGSLSSVGGITLNNFNQSGGSTASQGNLTVNGAYAQGASGSVTVGGNASLTNTTGNTTPGTLNVTGSLSVTSPGGDVTQAAGTAVQVQGSTAVNAGTHDVKLDGAANDFVGRVQVTARDVTLVDGTGGLVLGNINAGGKLEVKSTGGDVTQAGGSAVQVTGTTTVNAGSANVTLGNAGNDFGGPVNATGNNVTLADGKGGLALGDITASGKLAVTSTGGDVTQAGGTSLQVRGDTTVNAGGANVTLANAANSFGGTVGVSAQDVTLASTSGGITLGDMNASGKLVVTTPAGNVAQAGGSAAQVQGATTVDAGSHDVVLGNAGNDFVGAVTATGKDVTLADGKGDLTLGNVTASGNLAATNTSGQIVQPSGATLNVTGDATLSAPGGVKPDPLAGTVGGTLRVNGMVSVPPVLAPVIPPLTLPTPPTTAVLTIPATLATTAAAVTSVTAVTDTGAGTTTGSGAAGSRITIEPMQAQAQAGTASGAQWVMVTVPQEMATSGFSFALPDWLNQQTPARTTVTASRDDGQPLPTWLRFEADRRLFVAESVPSGGLPLKVRLTLGDKQVILLITGDAQVAQPGAGN